MLKCKDAVLLMKAYMEGELPAQLVPAFNKHVWGQSPDRHEDPADEGCEDCKRHFVARFSVDQLSCKAMQWMSGAYLSGRLPEDIANFLEYHVCGDENKPEDQSCQECQKFFDENYPIPDPPPFPTNENPSD